MTTVLNDTTAALDDATIDTIVEHAAAMASPLSQTHIHHIGGEVARKAAGSTAFGHRDAPYLLNVLGIWTGAVGAEDHIQWVRNFTAAMAPSSVGVYVNFLADEGQDAVRASYEPESFDRLVALKTKYDPTNLFRLNQNIKPR